MSPPRTDKISTSTHIVQRVAVSNRVESKISLEANKPSGQTVEHLCQWGMHVEVVFPSKVLASKGSKVNLVKDDLIRLRNAVESDDQCRHGQGEGHTP